MGLRAEIIDHAIKALQANKDAERAGKACTGMCQNGWGKWAGAAHKAACDANNDRDYHHQYFGRAVLAAWRAGEIRFIEKDGKELPWVGV